MELHNKLLEIQDLGLSVVRDTKAYNYKYADLEQVWSVIKPEVQKRKLLVSHYGKDGEVCTMVTDGKDKVLSCLPIPDGIDPQKQGAAITYFRRYNLLQLFNIMVEDDDAASTLKKAKTSAKSPVESNDVPF